MSWPRYAQRPMRSFVLCVLLLALLALHRLRRPAAQPMYQDLDALMTAHAGDAVDRAAKDFATHLDYTPESVERLEVILAQLHERHMRQPLSDREVGREARLWGSGAPTLGRGASRISATVSFSSTGYKQSPRRPDL